MWNYNIVMATFPTLPKWRPGLKMLKENWRLKSAIFPTLFLGKASIRKVKLVELFPLVYFFFARKLCLKLGFSCFCSLFIEGSKVNQQPAVMWGTERKRTITKGPLWERENSFKASVYLICQKCLCADSIFTTNISYNASIWGAVAWLLSSLCNTS